MTTTILFVDSKPEVLAQISRRFASLANRCTLLFASAPAQAIKEVENAPVDVIVSGLDFPGMSGTELLQHVREHFPRVLRCIFLDQADSQQALQGLPVAHQVLDRACNAQELVRMLERMASPDRHRDNPVLARALSLLQQLPAVPNLYWELSATLDRPGSDAKAVAAIIERDVSMSARVLQMANSAFFGRPRRVRTVRDAVTLFGLWPLKTVLLTLGVCRALGDAGAPKGFSVREIQDHSFRSAQATTHMLSDVEEQKTAFSAAMLQDIGSMVLAVTLPQEYERVRAAEQACPRPTFEAEQAVLGCTHAEIGAQALSLWNFPLPVVEAVRYHHQPSLSTEVRFGATAAVHVAGVLAMEAFTGKPVAEGELDEAFLQKLGITAVVASWRKGAAIKAF